MVCHPIVLINFQYPVEKSYTPNADIDSCLSQLKWNDRLAVHVGRIRAGYSPLIGLSEMYCFPSRENIISFPITVRVAKKYEFLPQVNTLIRRSLEAGLFEKWQKDCDLYRNDSQHTDDRKVILTVTHIGGALLSLFCGLSLAALIFIAECIAFHKSKQVNRHRFWLFLSQTVDGRRFYCQNSLIRRMNRKKNRHHVFSRSKYNRKNYYY